MSRGNGARAACRRAGPRGAGVTVPEHVDEHARAEALRRMLEHEPLVLLSPVIGRVLQEVAGKLGYLAVFGGWQVLDRSGAWRRASAAEARQVTLRAAANVRGRDLEALASLASRLPRLESADARTLAGLLDLSKLVDDVEAYAVLVRCVAQGVPEPRYIPKAHLHRLEKAIRAAGGSLVPPPLVAPAGGGQA